MNLAQTVQIRVESIDTFLTCILYSAMFSPFYVQILRWSGAIFYDPFR